MKIREFERLEEDLQEELLKDKTKNVKRQKVEPDILISVIIPVYNAEKYLKTCLDSIINQTYKNIEIVCVDDGSTDHSLELLRLYEKKDTRIKVYTQKNAGPSAARNRALEVVKGDYISFVDADDFLQENAYEILAECAVQKEKWDLIIFGGNIIGEGNDYLWDKLSTVFRQYKDCKPGEVIFKEKAARPFLWLHFIKRQLFEQPSKIRFDKEMNLGEDQIIQFAYVPRAKNVMVIDDRLYNYRIAKNASLMQFYNNQRVKKANCHFQIIEKVIHEWKEFDYYDTNLDELWTWIVNFIYYSIIEFPPEFKKMYSAQFLELMKKNCIDSYIIAEWEQGHLREIKEWNLNDMTAEAELKRLVKQIEREQFEIDETLKSKAFKIGRMFTKKDRRISI